MYLNYFLPKNIGKAYENSLKTKGSEFSILGCLVIKSYMYIQSY